MSPSRRHPTHYTGGYCSCGGRRCEINCDNARRILHSTHVEYQANRCTDGDGRKDKRHKRQRQRERDRDVMLTACERYRSSGQDRWNSSVSVSSSGATTRGKRRQLTASGFQPPGLSFYVRRAIALKQYHSVLNSF